MAGAPILWPIARHWRDWRASAWGRRLWRGGVLLVRSCQGLIAHDGSHWAAAIAYYGLLSIFPLILLLASLSAAVINPVQAVAQLTSLLGPFAPGLVGRVEEVVLDALAKRQGVGPVSVATLFWTGSRAFSVLSKGLNAAYGVEETGGVARRQLREFGMLLTIGIVFALALAADALIAALRYLLGALPLGTDLALRALHVAAPLLLLPLAFSLIYRFMPRDRLDWRVTLTGAALATALFVLAQELFLEYLEWVGGYNLIYGSLAVAIVLAVWACLVALIILFGGEVAARLHRALRAGARAEGGRGDTANSIASVVPWVQIGSARKAESTSPGE